MEYFLQKGETAMRTMSALTLKPSSFHPQCGKFSVKRKLPDNTWESNAPLHPFSLKTLATALKGGDQAEKNIIWVTHKEFVRESYLKREQQKE